ncbi:MAG: CvpA family protein [Bacillota bacterium]
MVKLEGVDGITIIDIVISIIFLYFIIRGYEQGIIDQTSKIVGLFVALFMGIRHYESFLVFLEPYFDLPDAVMYFISFAVIFITVNVSIYILGAIFKQIIHVLFLGIVDSFGGALLGLVKGGILVYFLVFILYEIPYEEFNEMLNSSYLARSIYQFTPILQQNLDKFFSHS